MAAGISGVKFSLEFSRSSPRESASDKRRRFSGLDEGEPDFSGRPRCRTSEIPSPPLGGETADLLVTAGEELKLNGRDGGAALGLLGAWRESREKSIGACSPRNMIHDERPVASRAYVPLQSRK